MEYLIRMYNTAITTKPVIWFLCLKLKWKMLILLEVIGSTLTGLAGDITYWMAAHMFVGLMVLLAVTAVSWIEDL